MSAKTFPKKILFRAQQKMSKSKKNFRGVDAKFVLTNHMKYEENPLSFTNTELACYFVNYSLQKPSTHFRL